MNFVKKNKKVIIFGGLWGIASYLISLLILTLLTSSYFRSLDLDYDIGLFAALIAFIFLLPNILASLLTTFFLSFIPFGFLIQDILYYVLALGNVIFTGIILAYIINKLIFPHYKNYITKGKQKNISFQRLGIVIIVFVLPFVFAFVYDTVKQEDEKDKEVMKQKIVPDTLNSLQVSGKILETNISKKDNYIHYHGERYYQASKESFAKLKNELAHDGWICKVATAEWEDSTCTNSEQKDIEMKVEANNKSVGESFYYVTNKNNRDEKFINYTKALTNDNEYVYVIRVKLTY